MTSFISYFFAEPQSKGQFYWADVIIKMRFRVIVIIRIIRSFFILKIFILEVMAKIIIKIVIPVSKIIKIIVHLQRFSGGMDAAAMF